MNSSKNREVSIDTKIPLFGKTKELGRIIGLNGTTELLNLLDERPYQYKDLEASLKLSHTSLLRRLNILQNLDIIKKNPIRSKRRETHEYDLTIRGVELIKFINAYEKEVKLPLSQQKIVGIEKKK
jgi:DNA-binding HxlR family transcriptional regulator